MANDTISRQTAIELWEEYHPYIAVKACEYGKRLRSLPSAERRGRWEDIEHAPNGLLYATCSVCGKRQAVECTNYCGNCGARMEVDE